jgi:hypothetical protein
MGLIDQIQKDVASITSNLNEFGETLILTSPSNQTITVGGLHTKHHLNVDTEGNRVNAKNASVAISEKVLTDASYTVRNSNKEVALTGHKVEAKDSSGIFKKYRVQQAFPDEEIGLIVFILEDLD